MYYLTKGLKDKGFAILGKVLAGIFAFLCVGASFGGGNAAQSNQAAMQLVDSFGMTGRECTNHHWSSYDDTRRDHYNWRNQTDCFGY
jgi:Na+/alanine symporter